VVVDYGFEHEFGVKFTLKGLFKTARRAFNRCVSVACGLQDLGLLDADFLSVRDRGGFL